MLDVGSAGNGLLQDGVPKFIILFMGGRLLGGSSLDLVS